MQFEALDRTMRVYETAHGHKVLPGLWMVTRLDGRSFTRLVREVRRLHPNGLPHMALWSSLCQHYQEPDDALALIRAAEPGP